MNIIWFKDCSYKNKNLVGGKNSSLGELYHLSKKLNFKIANGFAITTNVYQEFIEFNNIEKIVEETISKTDTNNIDELNKNSEYIKNLIIKAELPEKYIEEIKNYEILKQFYLGEIQIAVNLLQ